MNLLTEKNSPGLAAAERELCMQVESLATQAVLGGLTQEQWAILVSGVRQDAEAAGRADVARIAAESLEATRGAANAEAAETLFFTNISRMQEALMTGGGGAEAPDNAEGSRSEAPPSKQASPSLALADDPEMISDFILESGEHLSQVELQMMTLERDPRDAEAINTVFRGFHTIKGIAGFLDLNDIREVAHETETLLDLARNQKLLITPTVVDVVLAATDFLKAWLVRLESLLASTDPGPAPERDALVARIRGASGKPVAEAVRSVPRRQEGSGIPGADAEPSPGTEAGTPDPFPGDRRTAERRASERRTQLVETRSVKVDTTKLDALVDMAGEMVIAEAMVRHHPDLIALRSTGLQRSLTQLARITGGLQKTAMSMRMVPVGGLFQKMNRLVRDLARKSGKQAEMESIGDETELDRNVVEELADPLMHMVRNAADHGLENPEERAAAGKDPAGKIRLRASHQAGQIVIEVSDDGRGLVRDRILEKARRTGLVDDGSNLTDSEVFNFIFHPGFSTAAKVTDVSGRGVGMDVVKKQILKLRGRIDIESTPGKGTTFQLRLPLTLAMIDGLVVGVGEEKYIVPISSVREIMRPGSDQLFTVEGRQEMVLVRNTLLPVVRLYQRFGVQPRSENAEEGLLVVAEAAGRCFCLLVDELIGKQEVVIKSLGDMLRDIPGLTGGAILGDGRVGLILDLEGIFRLVSR